MQNKNNRVLIIMDMPLFPYRIYAYNQLAERGYDLTVVSASNIEAVYEIPLKFKHIRYEVKKICNCNTQSSST